jgi:uncharacterized protein YdhG (YjbR/CyaY superfamily)
MANKKEFKTVDEYINNQPEGIKKALIELRACILEAAPGVEEKINYNIPAFALVKGGKREQQIMIAGYAKHVGLYPHPTVLEHFDNKLESYKKGKGSVQFSVGKPLPRKLIIDMVRYRKELLSSSFPQIPGG